MMRTLSLGVLGLVVVAGCASGPAPKDSASSSASSTATVPAAEGRQTCRRDYTPRALPTWANAGFTPPTQPMPYVVSDKGNIVAILWADHDPLVVPPAADRNNKILWVARVTPGSPLHIRARLIGSDRSASRAVEGGPGPSIIDLPAPGCWSLDLEWGKQQDHLSLEYAPT